VFLARIYGFKVLDLFLPIYPLYAVMFVQHGLTPVQLSVTLVAWSVTCLTLQIPSGLLADRLSRRWVLCAGQLARAVGFLAWLLFPGFWGFFAGLVLWGIKSALTNGVFEALVYDELAALDRQTDYARVIGRAQASGSAAQLAASLSAAALIGLGYPAVIGVSLAAALVGAGAAAALPRAPRRVGAARIDDLRRLREAAAFALGHVRVPALFAMAAASLAFGTGLEGFWPIFAAQAGLPMARVALFVATLSAAQALAGAFAHRAREAPEIAFHLLFVAVGLTLALAAGVFQPWTVALVVLVAGLFRVIDVNFDARLHAVIPTPMRATLASAKAFLGQVGMTVVLSAFGPLAQATSYRLAFLGGGVAVAALGVAFLAVGRFRSPRNA
jgi:MFS family permease